MYPEEQPISRGRRLFNVLKKIRKHGFPKKSEMPVRPSEMMMLHSILRCLSKEQENNSAPVGVTISELSDFTDQTPSSVSQIIKALEEKGLVQRMISPADRRLVYVNLSERGNDMMCETMRVFSDRIEKIIDALGEEDADQLITLLEKLSKLLDKMDDT